MNSYPTIALMLGGKRVLPAAVAVAVLVGGLWLSYRTQTIDWTVAATVLAAAGFVLVRSYLEVLEVISDTLIPK